jgi:hypothetical protein
MFDCHNGKSTQIDRRRSSARPLCHSTKSHSNSPRETDNFEAYCGGVWAFDRSASHQPISISKGCQEGFQLTGRQLHLLTGFSKLHFIGSTPAVGSTVAQQLRGR